MILTNGFDPDPRVYKEAVYLVGKGFNVTVLCWDRDLSRNNPENEEIDQIKVIRYKIASKFGSGYKQLGAYLKYIRCCNKYLHRNPPRYIHCNDLDGMIAGSWARRRGSKLVFDMHELYEDVGTGKNVRRKLLRAITKHYIRKSQAALYENDLYLKDPYKGVQHKLLPLKNYPDASLISCEKKASSKVFRIGYYGGIRAQYNQFKTLFEAVKELTDVMVYIRGCGPDLLPVQKLSEMYPNVTVGGPFDGTKELGELYRNTDVVFAGYRPDSDTREYAEVVKFYECILTGTPIILTQEYTKMANMIKNRTYGLTCDTLNVKQLRDAIVKLKDDGEFYEKCVTNELMDSHMYDWNQAVSELDKVYRIFGADEKSN